MDVACWRSAQGMVWCGGCKKIAWNFQQTQWHASAGRLDRCTVAWQRSERKPHYLRPTRSMRPAASSSLVVVMMCSRLANSSSPASLRPLPTPAKCVCAGGSGDQAAGGQAGQAVHPGHILQALAAAPGHPLHGPGPQCARLPWERDRVRPGAPSGLDCIALPAHGSEAPDVSSCKSSCSARLHVLNAAVHGTLLRGITR